MSEEIKQERELTLKEIEVHKLNVQPGDMLMVSIKNDDVRQEDMVSLKKLFSRVFPRNQILMLNVGSNGDVRFSIVSQGKTEYSCKDDESPGYCSDCDCGKKERVESERKDGP